MPHENFQVVRHSSNNHSPKKNNFKLKNKIKKIKEKLPKFNFKKLFKRLVLAGIVFVLLFAIYLVGAFAWYSRSVPDPNKILERNLAQSTKIYDRTGEKVLYDIHGDQQRTLVKLEDIPEIVQWATISAEDKYFYEHHGFNILAMIKGVIIDPLLGRRARGGSTLTQQFVKNAILTNERKISRKIKEFILSYQIEKVFTKQEILQMYLNEIPYGSVVYGVQSASQSFFGKDVKDLTLGEATILAALPQAPTYYSPYGSHLDELYVRQGYVLQQMIDNGYITKEQADAAKNEKIEFVLKRQSITAPHFVMYVKELLSEELGEDLVETGGLKVITTLDLDKQGFAEEAVLKGVDDRGERYNFSNAALLSLDTKTGQILAMVGSKDYFDLENDGNVNVTMSLRQPGSSMKPLVYAAAFDLGYTPDTILYDVETTFKTDTKDYHPLNYDGQENGPVTMRKALAGSLNISAVKTLYLVGIDRVIDLLELMGYTSFEDRSRFGLSLVLGGGEVRMTEHTAAYAAIANNGIYHEPVAILRVEDSKGNVLMEYNDKSRKVMDKKTATTVMNVMSDNNARAYVFGLNNYLTLPGRPVAAKTGTTNYYRDAWTVGFTPSLATVVWAGNNDNSKMNAGAAGGVVAAPIWQDYMTQATQGQPVEYFPAYEKEITGKAVLDGDISPDKIVKIDKQTGKLATDLTPPSFVEEKQFKEAHCILNYVYKNDPRGGVPENPAEADPAYTIWEQAVQDWVLRKVEEDGLESDFISSAPPTEYDDVHTEENKPTIFLNSPRKNSTITSQNFSAEVNVFAPRGISRVEYFVDDINVCKAFNYPYSCNIQVSYFFASGYHSLKAVAFDDVDNSNSVSTDLNFRVNVPAPTLTWQVPSNNILNYDVANLPFSIQANLSDLASTKTIKYFYRNSSGETKNFATTILPNSDLTSIEIADMSAGTYTIWAEFQDYVGNSYTSNNFTLQLN